MDLLWTRSHLAVPWAGVALVGDAGHGVTPNLGQGCNAALETVAILDKVSSALSSAQQSLKEPSCSRGGRTYESVRGCNQHRCKATG
jgi:2-polyprenyl-6-methoxyphenol hydroxylase-like FAD-dependent oxidoreductase